jgi:hypothetical protein
MFDVSVPFDKYYEGMASGWRGIVWSCEECKVDSRRRFILRFLW